MLDLRYDHLGVAVADLDAAVSLYRELFGHHILSGPFEDPLQDARVVFLGTGCEGEIPVELIAPLGDKSQVSRMLAKGVGAYHVCYRTADIAAAVERFRAAGSLIVSRPVPAVAYGGRRIAWLYLKTRQLVELVEQA